MIMVSTSKRAQKVLVPAIAAGLLMGALHTSQAQSALFMNDDGISSGAASITLPATGSSITHTYPTTDYYDINSAGTNDGSIKDGGQGIGADIRLSIAGNGIRLYSSQNTTINTSTGDIYTFYTTIHDQASGQSGVLYTTFTLSTQFNEGTSSTSAVLDAFGSVQGGMLSGNSLVLGTNTYSASRFNFTPPSAPPQTGGLSSTDGAFSEHITAINTVNTPEPGAVATLVGLGITGSAFVLRRRR